MSFSKFVIALFVSTFLTMVMFYSIKKLSAKYPVPVVSEIVAEA